MKRLARLALLACLVGGAAWAQEGQGAEGEGGLQVWKWVNFLLLAGAIGYGIGKSAPGLFAARSLSIRKDMVEAEEARREAEARAAAVDQRLANLEAAITALRAEAHDEARAETQRITQRTAAEIAKIQAHAEQEIASAGKSARLDLRRYAAHLSIGLAEQKIQAGMTPATQDALVRGFVRDLK